MDPVALNGDPRLGRVQSLNFRLELEAQLRRLFVRQPVRHLRKDFAPREGVARIPRETPRRPDWRRRVIGGHKKAPAIGRGSSLFTIKIGQATFKLPADERPVRLSATIS